MQNSPDTIVSAGNLIEGKIEGTGILQVLGTIRGDVVLEGTLLVDAGGLVDGTIIADHVLVVGSILGQVHAREILEITSSAELSGTYSTNRLVVEQGAKINAAVKMMDGAQPAITPSRAPAPAPAAPQTRSSFFDRKAESTITVTPAASRAPSRPAPSRPAPPQPAPTPVAAPTPTPAPAPAPRAAAPASSGFSVAPPAYQPPTEAHFSDTAAFDPASVAASMDSTNAILERAQAALANSTATTPTPEAPAETPEPPPVPEENAATTEVPVLEATESNEGADTAPAEDAEKKKVAEKVENPSAPENKDSKTSGAEGEPMSLMFSEMLDEAEGASNEQG